MSLAEIPAEDVSVASMDIAENAAPPDSGRRPAKDPGFIIGDHVELRRAMVNALESDAPPICDLGGMHAYSAQTGAWTKLDRSVMSRAVQGFSGLTVQTEKGIKPLRIRKTDVDGAIALALDEQAQPGFFDAAPHGLAFSNGFLRILDGKVKLTEHDPDNGARFSYPFAFDPQAKCPRWIKCLEDAFKGDYDAREKIAVLEEFAGASLFGLATAYQRSIVMWGSGAETGDNGKSTIADIIAGAMPSGSVSHVAPQSWGNEYRRDLIAGKLLNVVSELPEADILDGESFKAMITGDGMEARAIYSKPYSFNARAGHLFSANRLPGSNDQSKGFWRRLIVLVFNRTIPPEEKIAGLAKIIVADELPGIVARLVAGARRLVAQGKYTEVMSSASAVEKWKREANPVATFLAERTRPARADDERTSASLLFEEFKSWADVNKYKVMTSHKFGLRMSMLGYGGEDKHTRLGTFYAVAVLRLGEAPPEPEPPTDPAEAWSRE
jgi:P4 family phage/plasmid primase-like protien